MTMTQAFQYILRLLAQLERSNWVTVQRLLTRLRLGETVNRRLADGARPGAFFATAPMKGSGSKGLICYICIKNYGSPLTC